MTGLKCYFKKIHNQLEANFNRALRKHGLTITQFDILSYLASSGTPKTLTDISVHFGVRHTSVIHVLKVLDQKGFITKNKALDARSKTIMLTAQAKELVMTIHQKDPLVNEILFRGLSEEDLRYLEKMLQQIYTNLESDAFHNI